MIEEPRTSSIDAVTEANKVGDGRWAGISEHLGQGLGLQELKEVVHHEEWSAVFFVAWALGTDLSTATNGKQVIVVVTEKPAVLGLMKLRSRTPSAARCLEVRRRAARNRKDPPFTSRIK